MATDGRRSVGATVEFSELGATLDTDGTLSADSDERIPSQKAVKEYVDAQAGGGGGGGVTTADLFQGYVPALGAKCNSASPSNVSSAQVTVSVSGATATITSDTDARPYLHKWAVIGTSGQSGKAALIQSISGDGLTITATNAGCDNPLATDAVAAQLILYGQPYQQGGDATWGPNSYTVQDPVSSAVINVVIRGGGWTGPMWNAGEWYTSGGATGFILGPTASPVQKITGITSNALVTAALLSSPVLSADIGPLTTTVPHTAATVGVATTAVTLDLDAGGIQTCALTDNASAVTITRGSNDKISVVVFTGAFTVTTWTTVDKWAGGSPPTFSGAVNIVTFVKYGSVLVGSHQAAA